MGCGSKRAMPQKKKSQRQISKANRASPPKRTESSSRQEAEESDRADDEREGAVLNVPTPRRESADEKTRDVGRLCHEVDKLAEELSCVIDQLRLEREEYRLLREEHRETELGWLREKDVLRERHFDMLRQVDLLKQQISRSTSRSQSVAGEDEEEAVVEDARRSTGSRRKQSRIEERSRCRKQKKRVATT